MTDETYFNIKINVEGSRVNVKKEHNLPTTLPELPPAAGVYIATLILAIENVIEQDNKMRDVIRLVCTPEEAMKVDDALQAVKMLIEIEKAIEEGEIEGENGSGTEDKDAN